jgi:membrane-associated HD superfamily phosphohydrolase
MTMERVAKRQKRRLYFFAIMFFVPFLLFGLYYSPIAHVGGLSDFKVDTTLMSVIFGASTILFGIWGIIIREEPKGVAKKWTRQNVLKESFMICFIYLVFSFIVMFLTALNAFSPILALGWFFVSSIFNASLLLVTINYYYFYEEKA